MGGCALPAGPWTSCLAQTCEPCDATSPADPREGMHSLLDHGPSALRLLVYRVKRRVLLDHVRAHNPCWTMSLVMDKLVSHVMTFVLLCEPRDETSPVGPWQGVHSLLDHGPLPCADL